MKKTFLLLIFAASLLGLDACRDKGKDPAPTDENPVLENPDFSISGSLYVHKPVRFISNFKVNQQLTWYFGGEEKNMEGTETTYTFTQAGTYTVTMASTIGVFTPVTKSVTITNGLDRVDGDQKWNFFLTREKIGAPLGTIPPATFGKTMALTVVDDTTIRIPDIPQMRLRGPYTVYRVAVTETKIHFRSPDWQTEFTWEEDKGALASIMINQVYKDTIWHLNGNAVINQ